MSEPYATIQAADVGQPIFRAFGRTWGCSNFIGRILPADVGKRVYLRDGILQVENDAQRLARHQREATAELRKLGADRVAHLSAQPDPFFAIEDEPRRPCDDDRGCGSRACTSCYGAE